MRGGRANSLQRTCFHEEGVEVERNWSNRFILFKWNRNFDFDENILTDAVKLYSSKLISNIIKRSSLQFLGTGVSLKSPGRVFHVKFDLNNSSYFGSNWMISFVRQGVNARTAKRVPITLVICAEKVFDEELDGCWILPVHVIGRLQLNRV